MKSMGLIVLLPFLSVIILSLHAAGGASRVAALALFAASVAGAIAGLFLKRHSCLDR